MNVAPDPRSGRPTVVVVGAGFGGLAAVRGLKRTPVEVVLLDQHNYHLFTPLLYQVASALLAPSEIAHPIRKLVRSQRNVDFRLTEVHAIDVAGRRAVTDQGSVAYDYLILAAGSVNNYFGDRTVEALAFSLKDLSQALALRNHILGQFERAWWTQDPAGRRRLLTFVVVGGGPTGVEYAGALSELIGQVLKKDFPRLDLGQVQIVLLEAANVLLSAFEPDLQKAAARRLKQKGITVMHAAVRDMRDGRLRLADGRELETATVIWTAGVCGTPLGETLAMPLGRSSRVKIEPTLQLPGHPEVFVIGDQAEVMQGAAPLPMLAPVAMQEGKWAAHNLERVMAGQVPQPFRYRDKGIMATIGRHAAVAQIGPLRLHGLLGWLTWLAVHLLMIIDFRSRLVVLLNWAWEYFLFDRPVRLIARAADRDVRSSGPIAR